MDAKLLKQMEQEILGADVSTGFSEEIPDDRQVHVIDNGATQTIADYAPVTPEEMPEAYEQGTDGEPASRDEREAESVLGSGDNVRGGYVDEGSFRDDFVEAARQRAKAAYGSRGELLDDFDQKFQEGRAEHAALVEQAPFTRSNPPSITKGILGGVSPALTPNGIGGGSIAPVTVAYWQGADAETTAVTCTLAPLNPAQYLSASASIRPFAVVQFGTRGFLATAEVDIVRGVQFTVNGSMVTLQVALNESPTGAFSRDQIQIAGMLSFSQIVKNTSITRTLYNDGVTHGNSKVFNIPAFAANMMYMPATGSAGAIRFDFTNTLGTVSYSYSLAANTPLLTPIPIGADVTQVTLNNTDGVATTFGQMIFGLFL